MATSPSAPQGRPSGSSSGLPLRWPDARHALNRRRQAEIAAAFASPIAIVAAGVPGPPRVGQWSGDTEAPTSLTVCYEAGDIRVTTYDLRWSEDSPAMFPCKEEDIVDWWVENDYSGGWLARQPWALDFGGLEVRETTFTKMEKGYLEFSVYEPLPKDEQNRRRLARRKAIDEAEHRVVSVPFGDSTVKVTVVGGDEMWAAGFETPPDSIPLSVLVSGGSVPFEALRLELVDTLDL